MVRAAGLFALVLVLAACGTASSGSAHQIGEVSLTVSGGITGWERKLVIDADGTAHLTVVRGPSPARTSYEIPAETLARLRATLSDPAFAQLSAEYPAPSGSADLQVYAITAEVDGHRVSTTTYDAAAAPQILKDVLALLSEVLDSFNSTGATCTSGYSSTAPAVQLGNSDDGTLRSAPLCASIWVVLVGPANGAQWQSIQSSDTNVLEIVPLPLPHPSGGGMEAVYLAKRTGPATLFAGTSMPSCPSGAYCPMLPGWRATITVG